MRTYFILFCLILTLKFANSQTINLQGEIRGIKDSTMLMVDIVPLSLGADVIRKEVCCINGKFDISSGLKIEMWHLARIDCKEFFKGNLNSCGDGLNFDIFCFVYPGDKISIEAEKAKYGVRFSAMGNEISKQQQLFLKETFDLEQQLSELLDQRNVPFPAQELNEKIEILRNEINEINISNIRKHLDWEYSAIILPNFEVLTVKEIYNKFSENVKKSFFGKHVENYLLSSELK